MVATVVKRLAAIGPQGLAGRAGWAGIVEVMQLISSLLVFVVLANLLTEADYGRLGSILGMAVTTASLTNVGSHILLIKRVSQGMPLGEAWPRATSIGILGPAVGAAALIGLQPLIVPDLDRTAVILLVLAQVNFFWLGELAVYVGNGTRRLKEAAQIRLILVVCRLGALGWFALWGGGALVRWGAASMVSFAVGAVLAVAYVWIVFGARPSALRGRLADVTQGAPFSVNAVTESLVDASDRPLLGRYGHFEDAGVYTLGGRIAQFGYLPLRVLMRASDADLFEAGRRGTGAAFTVTRSLLGPGAAVGVVVGLGMLVISPVLPLLVPGSFDDLPQAVRLLAALPLVRGVQWLLGNTLSASDRQPWRLGCTISAAVLNLGLNLILLPTGTWRTAVFTTMISELYLTGALALVIVHGMRVERRSRLGTP